MISFKEFIIQEGILKRVGKITRAAKTIMNLGGKAPRNKNKQTAFKKQPKSEFQKWRERANAEKIKRERENISNIKKSISPQMEKIKISREKLKRMTKKAIF